MEVRIRKVCDYQMQIRLMKTNQTLINTAPFDPVKSFECGQCFRWHRQDDGSYTGVVSGKVLNVRIKDNTILLLGTSDQEFQDFWAHYFDLCTDYAAIEGRLLKVAPWINPAITSGEGIHIFRQNLWEVYISFIISSNNNISRISGIIETISRLFGKKISSSIPGEWYSFPQPEALLGLREKEWRELSVGYRAPYLVDAIQSWHCCKQEIDEILHTKKEQAAYLSSCSLQKVSGIGPKVASCIQLFGTDQRNVFPIDVWVRRAMIHFYYQQNPKVRDETIQRDALALFGRDAGFAQQYLFYHARTHWSK